MKKILVLVVGLILTLVPVKVTAATLSISNVPMITIMGNPRTTNVVQMSNDVNSTNWTTIGTVVLDNGGCGVFFDTNVAGGGNRFYQTVEVEVVTPEIPIAQCLVSTDQNSPRYEKIVAGAKNVVMGIVRLRATLEDQKLTQVGLKLTTGSPQSVESVSIYDGSTRVGGVIFIGTQTNAVAFFDVPVSLSVNSEKVLTIKADIETIGFGGSDSGIQGGVVMIDVDSTTTTSVGQMTGVTINASGTTRMNGVQVFKTVPRVTVGPSRQPLVNGYQELIHVSVIADGTGSVSINGMAFWIETTTASVVSYKVHFATGGNYFSIDPILTNTDSGSIVRVEFPENIVGAGAEVWLTGNVTMGNYGQSGIVRTQLLGNNDFQWTSLLPDFQSTGMGLSGFGAWSILMK